jgi:hypothetical protein
LCKQRPCGEARHKARIFADKAERNYKNLRMNSQETGLRVASIFFGIFAIGHLVRLIKQAQVTVGTLTIPMGVSWVALIIAAILCVWLWRLSNLRS